MTKLYPKFYSTYGEEGISTIYVKDSSNVWIEVPSYSYFKVLKQLNNVSEFEVEIFDIEDEEKLYVKEYAEIMFFSDNTLILHGRIQKVKYSTAYECTLTGYGYSEAKLLERDLIKSGDKRIQYTDESAQTICNEILSTNTDGVTPWIIEPSTSGIFSSDYGDISIRYEYINRLTALSKLAESLYYEWGIESSINPVNDKFFFGEYFPSTTRATVSQFTFEISGTDANCSETNYEKDVTNLVNYVTCLGYGDGINQLSTSTYNASPTNSTLSADITATSTTISLEDASSFASSGTIRIMEEIITYSGKSTNNLTGCTRGTSSTTARIHKKGCYVEKNVTYTSPESGSSIYDNGLSDATITNRDIIDLPTLELVASVELLDRMNPIERISLSPNEPQEVIKDRSIGDLVTIEDDESSLSGDYRIVKMTYESNYGDLSLEIECSNGTVTFIEQMQKQQQETKNLSTYMQGSTNCYAISEAENCDSTHYLNMRFFVPNEAIAINKVLLNFKLKNYRAYESSNATSVQNQATMTVPYIFNDNYTYDSSSTTWAMNTYAPYIGDDYSGGTATIIIFNSSGSSDVYDYLIGSRLSPSTLLILYSNSYTIANGAVLIDTGNEFTSDEVGQAGTGYQIELQVSDGILGTQTGQNYLGYVSLALASNQSHTHTISYGIYEETLSSPSVDVYTGEDDGSMTKKDTYTSDQTEIDITDEVRSIGVGKWANVQFRPNKNMRIEANAYVQIFIDSK